MAVNTGCVAGRSTEFPCNSSHGECRITAAKVPGRALACREPTSPPVEWPMNTMRS
nr:hypothetical protein [Tessaracoccus sp.]